MRIHKRKQEQNQKQKMNKTESKTAHHGIPSADESHSFFFCASRPPHTRAKQTEIAAFYTIIKSPRALAFAQFICFLRRMVPLNVKPNWKSVINLLGNWTNEKIFKKKNELDSGDKRAREHKQIIVFTNAFKQIILVSISWGCRRHHLAVCN